MPMAISRSSTAPRTSAGWSSGAVFAPNYIENKLKFFPYIKEAVAFGHERAMVCAFINIDLGAVGNWAERRGLAYSGYTDLACKPEVYQLIQECVEQVNAELAADPMVADSQVHRFLVLHKELDPDDDELTRTRKVRRGFIAEKYAALVDALYGGKDSCFVETEVKFEDGRRGKISADVQIRDAKVFPARAPQGAQRPARDKVRCMSLAAAPARIGEVLLSVENISLSFGGVKALTEVSFDVREGEIRAIIGPNGAGKSLDAQRHQRRVPPAAGHGPLQGRDAPQDGPAPRGRPGHRAHLPEHRPVQGHDGAGQHHDRTQSEDARHVFSSRRSTWGATGARSSSTAPRSRRSSTSCRSSTSARHRSDGCPTACRSAWSWHARSPPSRVLLLLDEPMAGMNVEEKQDMCRFILDVNDEFGTTIVLIEHDMGVVMDISDRIVVLDYGRKIADGYPDEVRDNQAVIDAYLGVAH